MDDDVTDLITQMHMKNSVTWRTNPPRTGKGRSSGDAQEDSRELDGARIDCMGESMQASPNLRKACHPHKSRIIFATEGFASHKCDKQEGEHQGNPPYAPLEEILTTQDGSNKRRTKIQYLIKHTLVLCGPKVPQARAPRGNMARQLNDAILKAEKGKERERGKGADGTGKLSTLSQRLLEGWRDSTASLNLQEANGNRSWLRL